MNRFDAYFFDFDGTIAATEIDIRAAWMKAIAKLRLPYGEFDKIFRVGPSLQEMSAMLYPDLSADEQLELQTAYKSFYDEKDDYRALPYPGVADMLSKLCADGKKVYIVTNKRYKPLTKCIRRFDIGKWCHGIFCPDIVNCSDHIGKEQMLALALRIANTESSRSLMVGDTVIDIQAGKQCSCASCAVTWGYAAKTELLAAEPDFIIDSPALLP